MVWKKHKRTTKPKFRAINLIWEFTLQSTTEVREYLRVTTCFNRAKELLACAELDIFRRVVRGNQTATELQYLYKSDKSFICQFAAYNLKLPL
jgi:hypothetical protein